MNSKAVKEQLHLKGPRKTQGTIRIPGSKSVSNRALLLAALAQGETRIDALLFSDDTERMLEALSLLGVASRVEETTVIIEGLGGLFISPDTLNIYLGNAGTAMRPLAAVLAASQGVFELTGDPRMKERPIGPLVTALEQLGANISYQENEGYPPLIIQGRSLTPQPIQIDGSLSSQYISAILMLLPLLEAKETKQVTQLELVGEIVSLPYIHLTLAMMADFGVTVEWINERTLQVPAGQFYQSPGFYQIESDASSASYFLAAGAIAGQVRVEGVGSASRQGDKDFAKVLAAMGAKVRYEPYAIEVEAAPLTGGDFDLNAIPDAAMTIATTALFAKGTTCIRNIANWRIKETDRLTAMATELRKVGAKVEEGEDWIRIMPPKQIKLAQIATYNDHRMAMCFSLLALNEAGVIIEDPACCEKTYPEYFNDFDKITL